MVFFIACLAVGVAAVVAVASLASSVDGAIQGEARQLLAADLKVEGRRSVPEALDAVLESWRRDGVPVERTEIKEMATVVAALGVADDAAARSADATPGRSQLVELKVVGRGYPFYGALSLEPAVPLAELLDAASTVVAPDLLTRLGLQVGDTLRIGGVSFRIAGTVLNEPDRVSFSLTLGPRVFLSQEGFDRTTLEQFGSRIQYRTLLRLPPGTPVASLEALGEAVRKALPEGSRWNVENYTEAQPALRQGLARMERFLGLVALLSLLIGGIGIAQTVRAWIAGRMDAIAVLKCLGMRPREVMGLYLGQAALLGLVGSGVGVAVGLALPLVLPTVLGGLVPEGAIRVWQPMAALRGLALGTGVALVFSVPPLAAARRVSPARVLRRGAAPLPASPGASLFTSALLVLGVAGTAALQSGSLLLGGGFTLGAIAVTGVLALAAWLLSRGAGRLRRDGAPLWLRYGLAALGRPGAATLGAVVALGLGIMVVLAMVLVQRHLTDQLGNDLPAQAPSAFLVDIQPDQWADVRRILEEEGSARIDSVPVVMARLAAIDGVPADRLTGDPEEDRRRRWALTREQRLTYLETLPEDNRLVAGELWQRAAVAEISIEKEFAERIGVGMGSRLTFDVQGVSVDVMVTSLRTVQWESFGLNFFLVVEPGVLEEAPQFRVATAQIPPEREQRVQDRIAAAHPNVTVLRIREILQKVIDILDRLGLAVRLLGGFTVLAGLAILAGAISAGAARRGREVALLKTLGMSRVEIAATFAVEYALVGAVAGILGSVAGVGLGWAVVTQGMDLGWNLSLLQPVLAVVLGMLLTVVAGLATSYRSLARRPVEVLRGVA
jgi:putative ABC transport system permease protein